MSASRARSNCRTLSKLITISGLFHFRTVQLQIAQIEVLTAKSSEEKKSDVKSDVSAAEPALKDEVKHEKSDKQDKTETKSAQSQSQSQQSVWGMRTFG